MSDLFSFSPIKQSILPFNLEKPSIMSWGICAIYPRKQNSLFRRNSLTRAESLGFTLWKQSGWFTAQKLISINDRGSSLFPSPYISKYLLEPKRDTAQWVFKHTCPSPPLGSNSVWNTGCKSGPTVIDPCASKWSIKIAARLKGH